MRKSVITSILALPMTAALAACTANSGAPGAPAPASASAAASTHGSQSLTAGMVLPIQAYLVSDSQLIMDYNAARILVSRCMTGYGFAGDPYPARDVFRMPADYGIGTNMPRRYGISDFGIAATYGYHLPPDWTAPQSASPAVSQAEFEVLNGKDQASGVSVAGRQAGGHAIQDGGCAGAATRELGGALTNQTAQAIDDQSLVTSQQNPAVQAATKAWSACMARSGYSFSTPYQPAGSLGSSFAGQPEVHMAMTDIDCKRQTRLVEIWFNAESAVQNQAIEAQQLQLNAEASTNKAVLAAAAKLLGQ